MAAPLAVVRAGRRADRGGWAGALAGRGPVTLVASLVGVGAAVGSWELGLVAAARLEGSTALGGVVLALLSGGQRAGGTLVWRPHRGGRRPAGPGRGWRDAGDRQRLRGRGLLVAVAGRARLVQVAAAPPPQAPERG